MALALLVAGLVGAFLFFRNQELDDRQEQRARDEAELTEGADEDATKPLRDEDYRFEIVRPGKGWKVAGPETMLELDIDALGGLFHRNEEGELRMWVTVAEWPNDKLRERVTIPPVALNAMLDNEKIEDIDFHGYKAARLTASGTLSGMPASFHVVSFQRERFSFTVVALFVSQKPSTRPLLVEALRAFHLMEGNVTPRAPLPTPDRRGTGWRLTNHTFESVSGLHITAPKGCALDGGSVAHGNGGFEEAVMVCKNPDRTVYVTPYLVPGATPARLEAMRADIFGGVELDEERVASKLAGRPLELRRFRRADDEEVLLGLGLVAGDVHTAIRVEYAKALRERIAPTLETTLSTIGTHDGAELAKVRDELHGAESILRAQDGIVYRDGVVLDFDSGIRWPLPPTGMWRVRVGPLADATVAGARIFVHEPSLDLTASVTVTADASAQSFHTESRSDDPGKSLSGYDWGASQAKVTSHEPISAGLRQKRFFATGLRGNIGYSVTIDWPSGYHQEGEPLAKALLKSFRVASPPKAHERVANAFVDRRFGLSLRLPTNAKALQKVHTTDRTEIAYRFGSDVISVSAIALDEGKVDVLVKKTLKDITTLLNAKGKTGKHSTTKLAGNDAKRIRFDRGRMTYFVCYFVKHNTLYLLATGSSEKKANDLAAGLELIPTEHGW